MGKRDIESWIASTDGQANDDLDLNSMAEGWESALEDWAGFIKIARAELLSSSTKSRIEFIESQLMPIAKHASEFFGYLN